MQPGSAKCTQVPRIRNLFWVPESLSGRPETLSEKRFYENVDFDFDSRFHGEANEPAESNNYTREREVCDGRIENQGDVDKMTTMDQSGQAAQTIFVKNA